MNKDEAVVDTKVNYRIWGLVEMDNDLWDIILEGIQLVCISGCENATLILQE
jgi:hypothetical protein